MKYSEDFYQSYLDKVVRFSEEDWVKEYFALNKKPNFWTILEYGETTNPSKKSAYEIRLSRMIRWLLDPNENHNLGNIFAQKLIKLIGGTYDYSPCPNNKIESIAEMKNIDVFYRDYDQNVFIAIEVKQYAKEAIYEDMSSQLDKYEKEVDKLIKKAKQEVKVYYIFLTPLGDEPYYENNSWIPVNYIDFLTIVDEIIKDHIIKNESAFKGDLEKIISDFRDDLARTVYILDKENSYIEGAFANNKKERDLTVNLAKEITGESDTKHLDRLLRIDKEKTPYLKETILLIRKYIMVQDHSPCTSIMKLTRMVYNYLSGDKKQDIEEMTYNKKKDTNTPIKENLIKKYDLDLTHVELTGGKGQGLHIYHKNLVNSIYLSGDTHGIFLNDGIHIPKVNDERFIEANRRLSGLFFVNDDLINQEELIYSEKKIKKGAKLEEIRGKRVSFEEFMEIVMKEVKELNDIITRETKKVKGVTNEE